MTQTLDEEVERMCNLSQGILEEGILYSVKAIMKMKPMSVEDALDFLDVEESLRPQILELLDEEDNEN